ncbi:MULTISPECIES: tetratricopeptide repeat protein [unclassified Pseudomonas]|uniref:tetratricopeptide repeat protein n=1 Tax=unclassified Pseudomonas TaxID=196821 RepID=UPI001CC01FFB|nr:MULTISPECIES: tetratricopeptide repeat protein [unclassified Pseudomonas]UCP10293.1 tetratricopeptide repeat protein [Pseudomonas sp. MM213]
MKVMIAIISIFLMPFACADDASLELPVDIKSTISENGYPSAVEKLKTYVESNPKSYYAYSALGKAAALEGDYKQSIDYFERAKTIKETNDVADASIYNSMGWVRFLNGDTAGAIVDINAAIENKSNMDSKVAEAAYNNLGLIYMYRNENDKAKENFDKAVSDYNSGYAKDNLMLMEKLEKSRGQQAVQNNIEGVK